VGLLEKISARRHKAFTQPPFWATDGLGLPLWSTSLTANQEKIGNDFQSYVHDAYKASGVVFACMLARQMIFAEARFQWREFRAGRPGELFGSPELALLENPFPGGTTGELLSRMEVTASLAGNYYATTADDDGNLGKAARGKRRIVHMRPDWTTIVIDSASGNPHALDARVVGYIYEPVVNSGPRVEPVVLLPSEVCHYSPLPDPGARFRGMSWLTPIIEEIRADKAATYHKGRFFTNGATPNMAITLGPDVTPEKFTEYVTKFKEAHQGADKAYKTLFLAGGADVKPLGADFRQLDFKNTQGAGETRVAAASGMHPTVVGLAEGLSGSSLNAGNFQAAARLTANKTMRPLWRMAAASLQTLVTPPREGASLWYDDRDIAFLHDDATDLAKIRFTDAQTLRQLVDGGYNPDSAVEFVTTNDLNRLRGSHSGLLPVQLQPPGSGEPNGTPLNGQANGQANGSQAALPR
jgi:phage portal protein BeeE